MAAVLQTMFVGMRIGGSVRRKEPFTSNGTAQKLTMKSKHSFQVEVSKMVMLGISGNGYRCQSTTPKHILRLIWITRVPSRRAFTSMPTDYLDLTATHGAIAIQVVVGNDEPQDSAMKRFRREVMSAGLVQEVRHGFYQYAIDIPFQLW